MVHQAISRDLVEQLAEAAKGIPRVLHLPAYRDLVGLGAKGADLSAIMVASQPLTRSRCGRQYSCNTKPNSSSGLQVSCVAWQARRRGGLDPSAIHGVAASDLEQVRSAQLPYRP
jgi:hypothetical protein